jgi:hypothetical protein
MPCTVVRLPDGAAAMVCSRGRRHSCRYCARVATLRCDGKLPDGKRCNAWICADHATHVGTDLDLCAHCQEREHAPTQPSLIPGE